MSGPVPLAVVFSREFPPVTVGGTGTVARHAAACLAGHGWGVHVVSTGPGEAESPSTTADGVTVRRVSSAAVYNTESGLTDAALRSHRRMQAAAREIAATEGAPRLVLLPDLFCYPEAAAFARSHRASLINILLQDFRALTPYDHGSHRVTDGVEGAGAHLLEVERKALLGSDHTVFISHALATGIGAHYPDDRFAQSVIHLGVDPTEIAAVSEDLEPRQRKLALLGTARDTPLLVACGRLVPVKGFDILLEALDRLGPVTRAGSGEVVLPHLAIVGVGPELERLRAAADRPGLASRVTFLGDIPRREALGWMSVADVDVVPSLWESFCYVCAEMMALGRPVVACAVDSLRELMPGPEFGFPVPVHGPLGARRLDPDDLADALRQALVHPARARLRGEAARTQIMERFRLDRFGDGLSALAASLASEAADG